MISHTALLEKLRPLHICVTRTGHVQSAGFGFAKLVKRALVGQRFLEAFEVLQPTGLRDMRGLHAHAGQIIRIRLRDVPSITMRGVVIDDQAGGLIFDLSFGIAIVDAVREFDLTSQDFAPSDLAVELLFLQEAKSTAMAASFSLNTRLDSARLAAETKALTDGLTGLHNRRGFNSALQRIGQSQTDYAILNIDLDLFKQVNDTLGHACGDWVLKTVASIMRRHTRKNDLLVRAGGDEFIILCPNLTHETRLSKLSSDLIAEISEPQDFEGASVQISASIGIGFSTQAQGATPQRVHELADIALYAAKRSGRGRYVFWSPDLGQSLSELDMPHVALR